LCIVGNLKQVYKNLVTLHPKHILRRDQFHKAKEKFLFLDKFACQWKVCSDLCSSASSYAYNNSIITEEVFIEFDIGELTRKILASFSTC